MAEMNERELLSAILNEVRMIPAELKSLDDRMETFRRETTNHFNKVDRRLRFVESDFEQVNERLDRLELESPQNNN